MKIIAIPARYGSTRLPGKPLRMICGKPLIQWVYERALGSKKKDLIIIATDDERIRTVAESFGAKVIMTGKEIETGTERVYQAIKDIPAEVVVNLQGDEPFIEPTLIDDLFDHIEKSNDYMATICTPRISEDEYRSSQCVKVVLDKEGYALYFSRAPIPYPREGKLKAYKHIGIYAYRKDFLERFVSMERGFLEEIESLEQLRALENGLKIKVLIREYEGIGVDTEEDLERAKQLFSNLRGLSCEPKPF